MASFAASFRGSSVAIPNTVIVIFNSKQWRFRTAPQSELYSSIVPFPKEPCTHAFGRLVQSSWWDSHRDGTREE